MDVIHDFPHPIREIEHCLIPLRDGTHLAARIWLPADARDAKPYPAILEYLPYRKRDGTAVRDALSHPWMAGQGYACVRVDMRGNGESQGLMADEYLPQEQEDALQVLDWLCAQPWCDGNLGMMGISWGGFNSLQVAARQPAALKAIITLCSTDDRYADDIHYKGGNLLMENQGWAATMLNFSAAVPDPLLVDDWQALWQQRLDAMPMLAETWLQHQTRDAYWRQGSVCEDYAAIKAAVYCVGGWGDAYKNTVPRLMQHLSAPKKAMLGPWIHKYPHFAVPNPAIGFLQEAKRWWDHWLKGIDNGVMDEPACAFYLQDAVAPKGSYAERPGIWVQTAGWPDPQVQWQDFSLGDSGLLAGEQALGQERSICSPLTTGLHQGEYCAIWFGPDGPTDQRRDDAHSLCFDSPPLDAPLALLGDVRLDLRLKSDKPCGQIVARLNAVAPDGQVAQITYGTLNLNLRDDFAVANPPVPGEPLQVRLSLDHVGYRLPAGYRLRLALSTASFPLLWPSRELATLTLLPELQSVQLPVFTGEAVECPFEAPQSAPPANLEIIRAAAPKRTLSEDVGSGEVCVRIDDDLGAMRFLDHGLWVDQRCTEQYRTRPWDPLSTRADIQWSYRVGRDAWSVEVDSRLHLHADAQWFYLEAEQVARCDGQQTHQRQWQRRIARSTL
ncbi:CocE/NonD family hydrolase [Pseudomonas protegens]|uniref:CocE/NonD family hydrolase n=1 Tax=Pseudomonas protegens TaxID=380021 RepID=UPI001E64C686|nr:CocE/NonD family hydrolase [Pseudomonas protegens]MCD9572956.1 CocE/NonD family hydrolase [Pseudomonas protegens]